MKVVFRSDASLQIGTGHVMRCLALADALKAKGTDCQFICRAHEGNLIDLIRSKSYITHSLPITHREGLCISPSATDTPSIDLAHAHWLGATQEQDVAACTPLLATQCPDWLIVDHYALDVRWERALAPYCRQVMVIDDLADREHVCDLLLDQNWHSEQTSQRYDLLLEPVTPRLLGPQYALLKPEYSQLRCLMLPRNGKIGRVLVFIGGSDPTQETQKVLNALMAEEFATLQLDVVIGSNYLDPDGIEALAAKRPATVLHRSLPSLAGLMARADLMIGAGGSTTWERMCLGLPCLVISIANNQTASQQALMAAGYSKFLGKMNTVDENMIANALRQAMKDPKHLIQLSRRCLALVDGEGVNRVTQHLLSRI